MTLHYITVAWMRHLDRRHYLIMKGTVIFMYSDVCGPVGLHKYAQSTSDTFCCHFFFFYHSQVRWNSPPPNWRCVHHQPTMFQQKAQYSWLTSTASLCILLCSEWLLLIEFVKRRKGRPFKFDSVLNFSLDATFFLLWILGKMKKNFGNVFIVCCNSSLV